MNKLARWNLRCALAYWIKAGRSCGHGKAAPDDARDWATSWGPWWPTNFGADEVRSCRECGAMEKRTEAGQEVATP